MTLTVRVCLVLASAGVDVSAAMVARARARHPGLRFEQGTGEHASFGRSFDYIVLSDLLPFVDDLLELFRNVGIEPTEKKIVVVKSTNHFMAAYGPIAKKVIYVESSGPLRRDHRKVPYTKVQRPIWPLDADAKPMGLIF